MRLSAWRHFLAVALPLWMAAPAPARAVDWSPDTTRLLGDPAYLPLAGQVSGAFDYTRITGSYDYSNGAGPVPAAPSHWQKTENLFAPSLNYGITDEISISAGFAWGNVTSRNTYTTYRLVQTARAAALAMPVTPLSSLTSPVFPVLNGPGPGLAFAPTTGEATYQSSGPENPVFAVTWRAIDQRRAPVNLDLTVGYAPDLFPARDPGALSDGTIAFGGQRGTLRVAVSRETRFLTALAYAGFGYNGRRDIGQPGGGEVLRYAPHPDYALGVQGEARPLPFLAVNFGVGAEQTAAFHVEPVTTGGALPSDTYRPGLVISPYVGVVVPFLHDHAAMEVLYQHDFIANETIDTPYGFSDRYTNQGNDLLMARLLFAFGLI